MPKVRFPLVGSLTTRVPAAITTNDDDQYFINCFPEIVKNAITGKTIAILNKRLGSTASSEVEAGATGNPGCITWTSNSSSAAPTIFSFKKTAANSIMFFNQSGTQIGADVTNTNKCLSMSETLISTTGNLTAVLADSGSDALEAWFFPEGGAWTQITDGDFPSSICAEHAHMDGYMFVMTNRGKIHNSDLNSLANWTATSFITAESMPDNGVGLARYKNFIVAFGDYSTEFFYNAGNATGSPLTRVNGGMIRVGALRRGPVGGTSNVYGRTIMPVGNTVYFLGAAADSGARGIFRLNGMEAEKISNSAADKLLNNGYISFIAGAFSMLGMTHIVFQSPIVQRSICYCVETGFWWYMDVGTAGSLTPAGFAGSDGSAGSSSQSYFTTSTNGRVYSFSTSAYQDNSVAYSMTAQTQNMDMDTRKMKFWEYFAIDADEQSSSAVTVSYSDDDYATFTTAGTIDLSVLPDNRIIRLGSSRKRAWKLEHSANTACRIASVEVGFREGGH